MQDLTCYSCKHTLANTTPAFKDDRWTAVCPKCAVVNKLTPTPDQEGHFTVSGAFFIVHKAPEPEQ